jgi:hypothetical protein
VPNGVADDQRSFDDPGDAVTHRRDLFFVSTFE